jgi:hypothetical protein
MARISFCPQHLAATQVSTDEPGGVGIGKIVADNSEWCFSTIFFVGNAG